jgi:type I restriction enzyme S subunit
VAAMRDDIKRRIEQIRRGEVPEGYKRIGGRIFPESWSLNKIKDFAKTKSGKTPDRDRHSEFYQGGNLNWFKTGELLTKYLSSSEEKITPKALALCGMPVFPKRSIILAMYGATIGKASILDENSTTNQACCCIFPSSSYDTEYIFYQITFNREAFVKISAGAAQPNINQSLVQNFCLPLCETNEQNRIAEILSTCDRVIDLKKKLIEDKKKVKKWLMQTLLTGMIRVKDIENGTPYEELKKRIEQIRNGQIPEGYEKKKNVGIFPVDWDLERLVKYADKVVDGTHTTPKYVENGVPFYSVETITSNDFKNVKFISHEEHLQLSKRCKVEKGDILLTRIGTIGKTALVDWDEEGSIYVSLALIKISNQNLRSYFYEYSKSSLFVKEVLRKSLLLATPPKINMNDIEKVELVISSSGAERTRIANILSIADKEIDLLNKDLEQWELKKKSLMQLLLTGIVRTKA